MRAIRTMNAVALMLAGAMASINCAHTQQPEPRIYVISESFDGTGGSGNDYCADEQIACFDTCWNSRPPLTSIRKGSEKHHEYCTTKCLEEFMDCIKEQEQREAEQAKRELRFPSIDRALAWLSEHKAEVAIGTIVVVAGVTFIVATGGSGALLLVPLALT
jgi:hypothetical protein